MNNDGERIVRLSFSPRSEGRPVEVDFTVAEALDLYVLLGDALWTVDDSLVLERDIPSAELQEELGIG